MGATCKNAWDNGAEGNYWSDYKGVDANDDGIGDTPYFIDYYNIDNYPLMNPWEIGMPPKTTDDYDGLWHTADFTITLTAVNGVEESYYRINDGPTRRLSTDGQPLITTESADNKLEYWSVDVAGKEEDHKILTGIKLDKTEPTADAGSDQTVKVGVPINFDGGNSNDNFGIVSYQWEFGDGTTDTGMNTTHTYTGWGTYTVTLMIKDVAGNFATDTLVVTVVDGGVGVKPGDWAKYSISVVWESTDPSATEPQDIKELRNMEWIKVQVLNVSGTSITVSETTHFKNGTEDTSTLSGDLKTGSGNLGDYIIAGNLSEGYKISETPDAGTVEETVSRRYAGTIRDVNHLSLSTSFLMLSGTEHTYWDKTTGFLCENSLEASVKLGDYKTTVSMMMKMTETNLWEPEKPPIWIQWWLWATIGVIAVVVVAATILTRRRRKAIPPEVATPTETTI